MTRIGRRGFLTGSGAIAASGALAAVRVPAAQAAPPAMGAPSVLVAPGGRSTADSERLAQMMLLVGDNGQDLNLEYLNVLIDRGLPKAASPRKILVIGAGPSGLAAANLLADVGHTVTVLEANGSRVGGRVKTFRGVFSDPQLYAEGGAMRLPDGHPLVLALADKLGVGRRPFYNSDVLPATAAIPAQVPPVVYKSWTGEQWTNGKAATFTQATPAGRSLIQVNGTKVTRAQYASNPATVNTTFGAGFSTSTTAALSAALQPVTVSQGRIDDMVQAWAKIFNSYDDYSMHEYLVGAGWDLPTIEAVGTLENLTSRLHYALIPSLVDHAFIRPDAQYWELDGGTASLTDALAAKLGSGVIQMGQRMTRLAQTDQGVRVWTTAESGTEDPDGGGAPTGKPQVWDADYAIVTIPFSAARFVNFEPALSYPKRRAIIEMHYDAATKVLLEFKTRFWEQGPAGFTGGGCVSDSPNRFTYFPSHAPAGSPGGVVLAAYTWSDDAMRWDSLTDGERVDFALDNMAAMFGPQVYQEFTGVGLSQSWLRARYALGEATIATPGQLHEHFPDTRTAEGRVHFAGDHTSLKPAWIEGALESGVRAALEVSQR